VKPVPIIEAARPGDIPAIRELLLEYRASLNVDLCFQQFDQEVQGLPGDYTPPSGALILARIGDQPVGMVALRPVSNECCEMKRLFVRPSARGTGLGRQLAEHILAEARACGYREMRLDTLPVMHNAQQLYLALGFHDIAPYYESPIPGTRYMALTL